MISRVCLALLMCGALAATSAAQIVRFETSVGTFDMVLNPTNNPLLQEHVDNMLAYVDKNSFQGVWINRAAENFVLQMGGFYSHTRRPPMTIESTRPVATFDPIQGEPATTIDGLSNTVGTVSLALPGGAGGTNQDGGTSSFFVNLASNTFLDADFTVFAAISDMTVINEIMSLMQVDRTLDPMFGAGPGNLAFSDVPLLDNGHQVFIQRAIAITDPLAVARARAEVAPVMAASSAAFNGTTGGSASAATASLLASSASVAAVVPEPATTLLAAGGTLALALLSRRRRR